MPAKLSAAEIQHAINLYRSGKTIQEVADFIGRSHEPVRRHLVKSGVIRPRSITTAMFKRAKRDAFRTDIVAAYERGDSVLSISHQLGISRGMVARTIRDAGLSVRSGSEANLIRFATASVDDRRAVTAKANAGRRGKKASPIELARKADWKQKTRIKTGRGEVELMDMLQDRGIATRPQHAIGPYNIDIRCGNVAVEVHSQLARPHVHAATHKRIEYLLDAGLNVIYVMCCVSGVGLVPPTEAAADDVAAFVQRTESDPTFRRQYRVIRRTGELVAECGGDLDDLAIVPMSRGGQHVA